MPGDTHVLVIDELGYLSHATDAANVLYRVVNERYLKHRPMLLKTNKPLAALGDVLQHSLGMPVLHANGLERKRSKQLGDLGWICG
jgi:DNA replication protein DnaC